VKAIFISKTYATLGASKMSDDKIQKAMEFLLEQQAKFDAQQQIIQQEINRMQIESNRMQADMYTMRQDMFVVRQDMLVVRQDMFVVQQDMHTMQQEIHFLQNQQLVSQKNAEEDRKAIYTLAKNTEQGFLEIREAIAHLIVINERLSKVSKQLTKEVANSNKRLRNLENKV